MVNICPVCGYPLQWPPADFHICSSCGTEFGYDDVGRSHEDLRAAWIFNNGIIIDPTSSTDDSLLVLNDLLALAKEKNGAKIEPTRLDYISQILFRSNLKLNILNPLLQPIADLLSAQTSKDLSHPIAFEPTAFIIGPDTWQLKVSPNQFSIERRSDVQ